MKIQWRKISGGEIHRWQVSMFFRVFFPFFIENEEEYRNFKFQFYLLTMKVR